MLDDKNEQIFGISSELYSPPDGLLLSFIIDVVGASSYVMRGSV